VLHVINKISPSGGAEVSLVQLMPRLSALGVQQELVTLVPNTDPEAVARLHQLGIVTHDLSPARGARRVVALRRVIVRSRPDLVHATLFDATFAARLAGAFTRVPVLVSLVNTEYAPAAAQAARALWKHRIVRFADTVLSRHATAGGFHAITEAAATAAVQSLGIDRGRITVIPRGRDRGALGSRTPERRRAARRGLGLPDSAELILTIGRQEPQKAQRLLVEAFARLGATRPDAVLAVAGRGGSASAELRAAIASSGYADRIRVLGLRRDVADLLCAADVFVLPSLWEGLGGVLLEAMAVGVPCVAFDIPPIREVLDDGAGVLVPVSDIPALAASLTALLDSPETRSRVVEAATARFDERFDLDRVATRTRAMYAEIAHRRPPALESRFGERPAALRPRS